ncbi:hypothetical protein TrVFT333_004566 [Trichoderma virens FT-333]|nr:hypothetical protein TrVFT333_004566 [Trichoderma virens FT-333]
MGPPNVRPITLDFTLRVPHMIDLVKGTHLPATELQTAKNGPNNTLLTGMPLSILQQLQKEWTTSFDWEKEQNSINQYHHFIAKIDGRDIHFVHEKSQDPNAIPIILLHGWPGSFLEMLPLVDLLVLESPATGSKHTSFNVVIPSLPGFALSSPAPDGWTTSNTADIFNKLMTEVLGYKTYAVHGTDWGCVVGYDLYDRFNTTVRATHLTFLPFTPLNTEQLAAANIALSPEEVIQENRYLEWANAGNAYFSEQATKPNTIGLCLYDNPVGQLAWIAEKIISFQEFGGHFPSLDNPPALADDIRKIGKHWRTHNG